MSPSTTHNDVHFSKLGGLEAELAAQGPQWLRDSRKAARARFDALGFPEPDVEEWRNTNISPIATTPFVPAGPAQIEIAALSPLAAIELGGPRFVFVNGRLSKQLSSAGTLPQGTWAGSLADALQQIPERIQPHLTSRSLDQTPAFLALNGAFIEDGGVVLVPDAVTLEAPIQLLFVSGGGSEPTVSHPRTLIVAGRESRVQVVETHTGSGESDYFTNAATEIVVGDNGRVEHYRLQLESEQAYHIATQRSRQGRDSRLTTFNLNLGGRLVRHDIHGVLDGEGGECRMNGLYLARGSQHLDNHTILDHASPHCDSRELYKGILAGRARTIFNGRIIVRPDAQKTDAKQSNPNLLLSKTALAHTRPQLEIYADDVKCTHGATVGRLDAESIFYLRSRGLSEIDARNLLIHAFAGEVLETVEIDALRERLASTVSELLPG